MTYADAIKNLLNKVSDKLTYPVNISVRSFSANHIEIELHHGRDINEILDDKMKNIDHISIQWLDKQNKISILSLNNDNNTGCKICCDSDESTIKYFNSKQFIKIDKDGKHRLLLYPLKENIEIEENGFVKQESLDYEEGYYKLMSIKLPNFGDYKYKHLHVYDNEEEFINAILLEFVMRHINYNNLAPDSIRICLTYEENISEEELYLKENIEFQKIENEINTKLINLFGLNYEEINKLKNIYNKDTYEFMEENNVVMELISIPSPLNNIKINLKDSKEKLIEHIVILKDNFDRDANLCLNLKERVSTEYLVKANEVLEKFPKSFEKKKDDLIKALFIFDYIQARKFDIDCLNSEVLEENKIKIREIKLEYENKLNNKKNELNKYEENALYIKEEYKDLLDCKKNEFKEKIKPINKIIEELKKEIKSLLINEKKALSENKKDLKTTLVKYPKMNQMKEENIFSEIEELIFEKAGQAKKLHSHLHKFLEEKY